jgi:hypothetical protein
MLSLSASPPVIGVAQSRGAFFVNNASVPGTATILDGTTVRTAATSSDVSLKGGERLTLASSSEARIFQDRMVLTNGMADLNHMSTYRLEAGNFAIGSSDPESHMRVTIDGQKQVKVVAIAGNGEVRNRQGALVARVLSGTALQVQAVGGNKAVLTGVLQEQNGKYLLTDETSKITVELRGSNLKKLVGKKIQVNGSVVAGATPSAGAAQVVSVASATVLAAGAAGGTAAGGAGGAPAGAGASAGISTTTIVVGGAAVAAGGTVAGLAAAGTLTGNDTPVSR